jgi:hypothetical protein
MANDRFGQADCLLSDGRVLIVGGTSVLFGHNGYSHVLATAELYNAATRTFSPTKSDMSIGRDRPTASVLPNGKVLIAGGQGPSGTSIDYSEVFDPQTETFSRLPGTQGTARMAHNAAVLPDGNVVLTGGWCAPIKATTDAVEEFDYATQTYIAEPALPFSSHDAAQVLFPDGLLLVAGGKSVTAKGVSTSIKTGAWTVPD